MSSNSFNSSLKKYYDRDYFESGNKSNYKNYSKGFNYHRNRIRDYQRAIHLILNFRPKRVLDIGCAFGYVVMALRSLRVEAYGVDISEYAINSAPLKVKSFIQLADISNLPFDNNYFDLVVSYDTLEHVPASELSDVLKDIKRVSSNNLYFEIYTDKLINRIFKVNDVSHVSVYNDSFWTNLFKKKGFKPARVIFPGGLCLQYKPFSLKI